MRTPEPPSTIMRPLNERATGRGRGEARREQSTTGDEGMAEHRALLTFAADIDAANEHDFNRWYEEEHIPERLAIPGFLSACRYKATVGGPKYLAVYEVADTSVFSSAAYLHFLKGAGETPWTKKILAACTNKIRNTYAWLSERRSALAVPSQGLLFVAMDTGAADEAELNRWYEEEHIGERLSIPGFIRATRYQAVEGGPKYLALYEVRDTDVFSTPEYLSYYSGAKETPWTRQVIGRTFNYKRNIYAKISERSA